MSQGETVAAVAVAVSLVAAGIGVYALLGSTNGVGTASIGDDRGMDATATPPGLWSEPFEGEVPAIHLAMLPDGTVVYYNGDQPHEHNDTTSTEWTFFTDDLEPSVSAAIDLGTREVFRPGNDPGRDLFCSGHSLTPDGRLLTIGGTSSLAWVTDADPGGPVKGTAEVFEVGPRDHNWTSADGADARPDMDLRRWYPTAVELPDGSTMAVSGIKNLTDPRTNNVALETLDPDADEWERIDPSLAFADGVEIPYGGQQGDTELAVANLPMYPRLFVVSGGPMKGEVFYPSDGDIWGEFGERPAEEPIWGMYQSLNLTTGTWTVLGPSAFGVRHLGATVPLMLDPADDHVPTLVTFGGTLQRSARATPTTEVVTLDEERPTPEVVDPLNQARWQPQGILLPSGEIVAIGGAELDTTIFHGQRVPRPRTAELFDPETRTWTELDEPMDVPRGYHSTAVLTPNATVLVGGGVENPNPWPQFRDGPTDDTPLNQSHWADSRFEFFYPPYLDRPDETRPSIVRTVADDAPALRTAADAVPVGYGQTFTVEVEDLEGGLDEAVLIRPGTSTHGLQSDQRGIRLDAETVGGDGDRTVLELTAPPDGAVAPPGHYMLFVNEQVDDGVYPSKAEMVRLG